MKTVNESANLLDKVKISCEYGMVERREDFKDCDPWKCRLTYKGRKITVPFYMGYGHNGKEPTVSDVLSSLISDARCGEHSFEEFCSDLGYDSDSRKAEKLWKECRITTQKMKIFLADDFGAFEKLLENY